MNGIQELQGLSAFIEECKGTGQGISTKDSVAIRYLSLLAEAPCPLPLDTIVACLGFPKATESVRVTLSNLEKQGFVREAYRGWIITGGEFDRNQHARAEHLISNIRFETGYDLVNSLEIVARVSWLRKDVPVEKVEPQTALTLITQWAEPLYRDGIKIAASDPREDGIDAFWLRDVLKFATVLNHLGEADIDVGRDYLDKLVAIVESHPRRFMVEASCIVQDREEMENPSRLPPDGQRVLAAFRDLPLLVIIDEGR